MPPDVKRAGVHEMSSGLIPKNPPLLFWEFLPGKILGPLPNGDMEVTASMPQHSGRQAPERSAPPCRT